MAWDYRSVGTKSGWGSTRIMQYLSSWDIAETAGGAATVKLRDALLLPTAPTIADGAAGNSTVGVHYAQTTWLTPYGESLAGAMSASLNSAGTTIITTTCPIYAPTGAVGNVGRGTPVYGRRVYMSKAGAPAASSIPTRVQMFRVSADLSTTVGAGSAGQVINPSNAFSSGTLTVAATASFAASGNLLVTTATYGPIIVAYTAIGSGTTFTGCTLSWPTVATVPDLGKTGIAFTTGDTVTQPAFFPNNTSTSANVSVADASFTAVNPPLTDTAGELIIPALTFAANQAAGNSDTPNVDFLKNDGGVYVEVTAGTVAFTIRGAN